MLTFLPTAGKRLVETPEWTVSMRAQYELGGFVFGIQGKYVGDRYATDVNDEIAPSYTTVDADIRYTFDDFGLNGAYIQLNALNLFDEDYLGSIATSQTNALNTQLITADGSSKIRGGSAVLYALGSPRTIQATIGINSTAETRSFSKCAIMAGWASAERRPRSSGARSWRSWVNPLTLSS